MNTLTLLQAAVQAKLDYWHASSELEIHLGYGDVPDAVDKALQNFISHVAASLPIDKPIIFAVTEADVDELGGILEELAANGNRGSEDF